MEHQDLHCKIGQQCIRLYASNFNIFDTKVLQIISYSIKHVPPKVSNSLSYCRTPTSSLTLLASRKKGCTVVFCLLAPDFNFHICFLQKPMATLYPHYYTWHLLCAKVPKYHHNFFYFFLDIPMYRNYFRYRRWFQISTRMPIGPFSRSCRPRIHSGYKNSLESVHFHPILFVFKLDSQGLAKGKTLACTLGCS